MRYAIISDIHGNLPAFNAVLDDAKKKDVDSYIFLGDYVLSMPYPNQVISRMKSITNKHVIKGNSEDYLDNIEQYEKSTWTHIQFEPIYWCHRALSKENREYLRHLPIEQKVIDGNINIFTAHSSSHYFNDALLNHCRSTQFAKTMKENSYTPFECLDFVKDKLRNDNYISKILSELPDGIYMHGHNHIQMYIELGNKLIINPGSCGFPLDYPNYSSYSILDISNNKWHVEERRIKYNIEKTIREFRQSDLYSRAKVWCDIMIKHLETGIVHDYYFLKFIDTYAVKPYSKEVWEESYEIWSKQQFS